MCVDLYLSFYLEFPMKTLIFFSPSTSAAWLNPATEHHWGLHLWLSVMKLWETTALCPSLAWRLHLAAPTWLQSTWWSLKSPRRCTDTLTAHLCQVCLATTTITMSSHGRSGKMWKNEALTNIFLQLVSFVCCQVHPKKQNCKKTFWDRKSDCRYDI